MSLPYIGQQIKKQEENILDNFSEELHPIVNYMFQHSIPFDHDGGFFLKNESGKVLVGTELGIEEEKVVFTTYRTRPSEVCFYWV